MQTASAASKEQEAQEARKQAAKASGGTSADPIYRLVTQEAQERHICGSVLDFGAGTGNLARLLCENPAISQVTATDIMDYGGRFQHPKLAWVFHDLNYDIRLEQNSAEAVFAVEVIEHLENPRHLARQWFRVLKPGGVLLVTTPNNENWRSVLSLLFKSHFHAFTGASYPAHITALLRRDMERIFQEAGFTQISFRFTDHGALPKFTRQTWQKSSGGLLRGLRYSDNLLCIAVKPGVS